jgi:hypothetical protein
MTTTRYAYDTATTIQIVAHWCNGCGIAYGLPEGFIEQRRKDHQSWTCPNGCVRHFAPGKSDAQKLEEAKALEVALRDQLAAAVLEAEQTRAALLRDRHRFANGVCPCCNRSFDNVRRHMASQHPDYDVAAVAKTPRARCSCGRSFDTPHGLAIHQGRARADDWAASSTPQWRRHLTVVGGR